MTDRVTASVVGSFPGRGEGAEISITPDIGIYNDSDLHFLIHPVSAGARATKGEVIRGDTKEIEVPSGALTFSGGRTAHLPLRPVGGVPTFKIEYAVDEDGDGLSVGLSYNGASNTLTATREFHGVVSYSEYPSLSRKLAYRPASSPLPGGGVKVDFGSIIGFVRPRSFIVYPVTPFQIINGNAVYELYRIVSYTVTTPEGEFETPPNYPTNGNYPDLPSLDISVSLQTKRTHQIGYMDESGRGWVNSYYVPAIAPYVGDGNYVIPTTSEVATISQFPRNLQQKALDFIASKGLGPS